MISTPKQQTNAVYGTGTWANMVAILEACRTLEAEGQSIESVNRTQLAAVSGVTANNEVAAGKQLYKRRRALLKDIPETPMAVSEVILRAVEAQFVNLKGHFLTQLEVEQVGFSEALSASTAENQALDAENESLSRQLDEKDQEIAHLKEKLFELETKNQTLLSQKSNATNQLQTEVESRNRCKALLRKRRHQIRRIEEQHKNQRQQQIRQWTEQKADIQAESEKALDRLAAELHSVRQEQKKEEIELHNKLNMLRTKLAKCQSSYEQQKSTIEELSIARDTSNAEQARILADKHQLEETLSQKQQEVYVSTQRAAALELEVNLLRQHTTQLESLASLLTTIEQRLAKTSLSSDDVPTRK